MKHSDILMRCHLNKISPLWLGLCLFSCTGQSNTRIQTSEDSTAKGNEPVAMYGNSVKGHDERDTIVGNFTGEGLDTIYVTQVINQKAKDREDMCKYYAQSNNPELPRIELFGCLGSSPKLVFEGDLDQDGKDEWGYLHTWTSSQWRQYRVYNYDSKRGRWRHLYYGDLLDTPEYLRSRDIDLVEKGPRPGTILIHWGLGDGDQTCIDTIVAPTYTAITSKYQ